MDRLYWFMIIFGIISGAWAYWYYQSETLKGMGTYTLIVPISTLLIFFVALWIILTYVGVPDVAVN